MKIKSIFTLLFILVSNPALAVDSQTELDRLLMHDPNCVQLLHGLNVITLEVDERVKFSKIEVRNQHGTKLIEIEQEQVNPNHFRLAKRYYLEDIERAVIYQSNDPKIGHVLNLGDLNDGIYSVDVTTISNTELHFGPFVSAEYLMRVTGGRVVSLAPVVQARLPGNKFYVEVYLNPGF